MRLLIALCLLATPAVAQDVDCYATEVQVEMTLCAEQDWMDADADLNAAYKQAMSVMKEVDISLGLGDKAAATYLKQAQRDWISYRDNACAAEAYPMHGGSAEPMVIYGCRARLTQERTLGLDYITQTGVVD